MKRVWTPHPVEEFRKESDPVPLSFAQQRLWFLNQLEPDTIAYNMAGAMRLLGSLNVAAMKQSLSVILRRHEALRTTFGTIDGRSFQVIAPPELFTLPVVALQEILAAERRARHEGWLLRRRSVPLIWPKARFFAPSC